MPGLSSVLTDREKKKVFKMREKGKTQKEIADFFNLSQKTIWTYLHQDLSQPVSDCLGERNSNSALTEKEVLEIRKLYVPGEISYRELAERYEVSASAIKGIIRRETWKHI
jgi:predicted DNA-binding protein YlxM (UPF0122 family)